MAKIVVPEFISSNEEIVAELKKLGEVKAYTDRPSPEEWVKRCQDADVICCGKPNFKKMYSHLRDTFVSLPFVGVGYVDKEIIKKNNVIVAYTPGSNKESVAEWIVAMLINLMRRFPEQINRGDEFKEIPIIGKGLKGRKVTILGKGNIGTYVEKILTEFEMKVNFVTRSDDAKSAVKDSDVVINTMSTSKTSIGLVNIDFFRSMKKGSYFLTITGRQQCVDDDVLKALDEGILAGVAHDAGEIGAWKTHDPHYTKFLNHPKVLVTPHIAWTSDIANEQCNNTMIENVKAYLKGTPQNIYE